MNAVDKTLRAVPHQPGMTGRIVSRERVYEGWCRIDRVRVEIEHFGETTEVMREVHDHGSAAAVLCYDPAARTAVLVRQLRTAMLDQEVDPCPLEAVAGLLDGDAPEVCARREAMEEAGLTLDALEFVAAPFVSPGAITERAHLFLAEIDPAAPREPGGGLAHEGEAIEVVEVPLAVLDDLAASGALLDMKTILLVDALRRRRPELFMKSDLIAG